MTKTPTTVVLFSEVNSKLGAPFLDLLAEHPLVDLAAVVTSPPGKVSPYFTQDETQVDLERQATALGIPVYRPDTVNDPELLTALQKVAPDYFIVGNFQQILKEPLLSIPRVLPVNFHPSPLPEYAGIAPFYWMIKNGARYSAITALEMTPGLDGGRIIMQRPLPLTGRDTAIELRTRQEQANVEMLAVLIPSLVHKTFTLTPQEESSRSYFGWPTDEDYRLDFTAPAEVVDRAVRAGYRHPGAYALTSSGKRLTVLTVDFAGGVVVPPLASPGTWVRTDHGVFVACAESWLRIITVEQDMAEIAAGDHPLVDDLIQQTVCERAHAG